MRNRRISNIRLDKSNVDAQTINRALDNIINTVNPFMEETVSAIAGSSSPVKDIVGGNDIGVTNTDGVYTIDYTGTAGGGNIVAGTGISVVEAPAGTFTITNTAPEDTNILAGSGIAVSESPTGTFTIINTNQGGGGGGGIVYYLNETIGGQAPTPAGVYKELGNPVQPAASNVTITLPNTGAWTLINNFITDDGIPNVTTIPAGLWDFNVWFSTNSIKPDEVAARISLYTWNGTTLTLLGTSAPVLITQHITSTQYTLSVIVPETTVLPTDRIVAILEGHVLGTNSHTITAYYGNATPSHVHSTIPFDYVQNIVAGTAISVVESPTGTYTITNTSPDQTVVLNPGTAINIGGTYPNFTITNTSPDQIVALGPGTGIAVGGTYPSFTITNTAPDQVVALSNGTGITVGGTYPNFTITNAAPDQVISLSPVSGISVGGTYPNFTLTNTLPDQVVSLTNGSGISIAGTYPNFTITNTSPGTPTVLTAGTGVTITGTSPNFTIAIGQDVATTSDVTFNTTTTTTKIVTPLLEGVGFTNIRPAPAATGNDILVKGGEATGGLGGRLRLEGGDATGGNNNGGRVVIDGGLLSGTGTNGFVQIGIANASSVVIGRTGINTTIQGNAKINAVLPTTGWYMKPDDSATLGNTTQFYGQRGLAGNGGGIIMRAGQGSALGGDFTIDAGQGTTGGLLYIGTTNAESLTIGRSGKTTTVNGTLAFQGISPLNSYTMKPPTNAAGGNFAIIEAGDGATSGGNAILGGGDALTSGFGGQAGLVGGNSASGQGGNAVAIGGQGTTFGGGANLYGGQATAGGGGSVNIRGGTGTTTGGDINIDGAAGGTTAGNINIGTNGSVSCNNINIGTNSSAVLGTINVGTSTTTTNVQGSAYTDNVYCFAEGPSSNITVGSIATPTTLVYNTLIGQNGINLNISTGFFTVPVTGIYEITFTGIMRTTTVPASTFWVAYELWNGTTILDQASCFKQVAASGIPVALTVGDNYLINLVSTKQLTAGVNYSIRAKSSQATANTLQVTFEPVFSNTNTSRAGQRYRIKIQRKT